MIHGLVLLVTVGTNCLIYKHIFFALKGVMIK